MHLGLIDALGFVAGVLTTISFIPQARHSCTTRDLSGISLRMYSLFTAGVALWMIYGIVLGNWPIAITNAITLVLACVVLILKLTHPDGSMISLLPVVGESGVKAGLQGVLGTVRTQ